MSANTPSGRAEARWRQRRKFVSPAASLAAASLVILGLPVQAGHRAVEAPALPPAVAEVLPKLAAQGAGELRFLGMPIYDGWYWAAAHRWTLDTAFVLDLHYHRSLSGSSIAELSAKAMERMDGGTTAEIVRWRTTMAELFPDVGKGDRITGVFLPPASVRYFFNGRLRGEIVDAKFARAFFGIWFDPRTQWPELRTKLLGSP